MERVNNEETEIELEWTQIGLNEWKAVVKERGTARRFEVCCRAELVKALDSILDGKRIGPDSGA
jgi:hypothetical protein